jgi:hypothetical protein
MPESLRLVHALVLQQLDVVQQNRPRSSIVTTRGGRPAAMSAPARRIHGLRSTPRPTRTPRRRALAGRLSRTPRLEAFDDCSGLDAVATAEHRNRQCRGDL